MQPNWIKSERRQPINVQEPLFQNKHKSFNESKYSEPLTLAESNYKSSEFIVNKMQASTEENNRNSAQNGLMVYVTSPEMDMIRLHRSYNRYTAG